MTLKVVRDTFLCGFGLPKGDAVEVPKVQLAVPIKGDVGAVMCCSRRGKCSGNAQRGAGGTAD